MNKLLETIETMNSKILDFLYEHVKPEEMVDDNKDSKLRDICKEIVKWYGEMGEYWCDNPVRIADNYFGVRFQPIVYTQCGKVEQINIIDNMTRRCVKECYQIRSANTWMKKFMAKVGV